MKKDNYTVTRVEAYNKKGLARMIDYRDYELVKGSGPRGPRRFSIWRARAGRF